MGDVLDFTTRFKQVETRKNLLDYQNLLTATGAYVVFEYNDSQIEINLDGLNALEKTQVIRALIDR